VPTPGDKLRLLRESLGFTLREVEAASEKIALEHGKVEFVIPFSRLFGIEAHGVVPNIYRIYSLSAIYRTDPREILGWYGVNFEQSIADSRFSAAPFTQKIDANGNGSRVPIPELDPSFTPETTVNLGMLVQKWGTVPLRHLETLANQNFTYGYVGTDDYTMYPLILPGTFLQIDESRCEALEGGWRSEYERPIFFVETRHEGFRVGWCSVSGGTLTIQPHPLSPARMRTYRCPQDAEIIGQVIAVGMRLLDWKQPALELNRKARKAQV
jgi:hypothetical protein